MLADARAAVERPYATVGQWSAGQIFDHLARAIDCSFDGFGFRAPLWIRLLVKPFRNSALVRPMRAGFQLPNRAAVLLPADAVPVEDALRRLEHSVRRLQTEDPLHEHPVLGRLTPEEYRRLHLRHSELHLGFIVPTQ